MSDNKKTKLFNKLLKEFSTEYKKHKELKDIKLTKTEITQFSEEVKLVEDLFLKCEPESLDNVTLCKTLELDIAELKTDRETVWKYLHNLYFICVDKKEVSNLIEISRNNTKKKPQNNDVANLGVMIQEVSKMVAKQLEGKDLSNIDPTNLMSMLTDGGSSSSGGINFANIIMNTTAELSQKINSGELKFNLEK